MPHVPHAQLIELFGEPLPTSCECMLCGTLDATHALWLWEEYGLEGVLCARCVYPMIAEAEDIGTRRRKRRHWRTYRHCANCDGQVPGYVERTYGELTLALCAQCCLTLYRQTLYHQEQLGIRKPAHVRQAVYARQCEAEQRLGALAATLED